MRQITTVKGQTIYDISLQEYGTDEAVFQILEDNPHLAGKNEVPAGSITSSENFNFGWPIKSGVQINIQDYISIEKTGVAKQLGTITSQE